eukprot:TRINITY_DN20623_c0_g1_i2.p2 TRINITY_DN20623_c0_g1~~TRINITY_DN20623_c0_g1_i2.p2  ORF type:complete len:157 (-),score=20.36 TRINITY_DN20623_c0_g1_i2:80-550(-)
MDEFLTYCRCSAAEDANPLYLFHHIGPCAVREERLRKHSHPTQSRPTQNEVPCERLLSQYSVPSVFEDDLFELIPIELRPPYRWLIVGAAMSGSAMHQDPLHTCAWNTLLVGAKLWVFFPPRCGADPNARVLTLCSRPRSRSRHAHTRSRPHPHPE